MDIKVTVIEERDIYFETEFTNKQEAIQETKKAIELVGLSNMRVKQESVTDTIIKIEGFDWEDIDDLNL